MTTIRFMNNLELEFEPKIMQGDREELIERLARAMPEDGVKEVMPGFFLSRASAASMPRFLIAPPAFCYIARGSKEVQLGDEVFRYDPGHYLISTVDLPTLTRVVDASGGEPYLGMRINLDPALVASVIMESGIEIKKGDASAKAMNVKAIDAELLDAVVRLIRLIETPHDLKFLAPIIIREIVFRLLISGQGARLSHLMASEDETRRISRAVKKLRENFHQPLKIENIARELGMSVSGFHHQFKLVTSMSPVQFQKELRLQEARRLMIGEDLDAATAGLRVGYESPTYFSREYKKMFGAPPLRDIARLRSNLET